MARLDADVELVHIGHFSYASAPEYDTFLVRNDRLSIRYVALKPEAANFRMPAIGSQKRPMKKVLQRRRSGGHAYLNSRSP
jgi:hypothetical protein